MGLVGLLASPRRGLEVACVCGGGDGAVSCKLVTRRCVAEGRLAIVARGSCESWYGLPSSWILPGRGISVGSVRLMRRLTLGFSGVFEGGRSSATRPGIAPVMISFSKKSTKETRSFGSLFSSERMRLFNSLDMAISSANLITSFVFSIFLSSST